MDKDDLLLNDEKIHKLYLKISDPFIPRYLDVGRETTKAELKKVVGVISKNGWWNNGQSCYCLSREFYMRLKKIAGIK